MAFEEAIRGREAWGLPSRGYKGSKKRAQRQELWCELEGRAPWLSVDAAAREMLLDSDDALDALVAALIARAAKLGLTVAPSAAQGEPARSEGWIHVPRAGTFGSMVGRGGRKSKSES